MAPPVQASAQTHASTPQPDPGERKASFCEQKKQKNFAHLTRAVSSATGSKGAKVFTPLFSKSGLFFLLRQPDSAELPACAGGEEIAISGARMAGRRGERGATQYILVHHKLAVIFADRPGDGAESGVR